jgi:hypothetical protein
MSSTSFEYIELPYCGAQTAELARRLSPYYHCVFFPFSDESQIEPLAAQGFYCRPSIASQDLSLAEFESIEQCLASLPAKRRNDITQSVRKAEDNGIEVSVEVFRHTYEGFRDIYSWYFDVYRPYAATHFPNKYKYDLIEDLNADLLSRYRYNPFVFAKARWNGKIVGGSFLRHIPSRQYGLNSSFLQAFPGEVGQGDVLQMSMLNSGHEPVGNINTFLYYCIIDWCIKQNYRVYSFGRENLMLPPKEYLNVVGSKRSWGTTTVLERDAVSLQFVLCNREALLHLRSDYFIFHWTPDSYQLIYFANSEDIPKALSQTLESDSYINKRVYTRKSSVFSYLEKRSHRWSNAGIILYDSCGKEEASITCS